MSNGLGSRGQTRMQQVVSAANRSMARHQTLAMDAGDVIAARTAIMANAMTDLTGGSQIEMAMMVPEKAEAFSQAGEALIKHSGRMINETARYASDEVIAVSEAGSAFAACRSPIEWSTIQSEMATNWLNRAVGYFLNISMAAVRSHDAAMAPIRQKASANAERLRK